MVVKRGLGVPSLKTERKASKERQAQMVADLPPGPDWGPSPFGVSRRMSPRFGFPNFRHSLETFLSSEGRNPDVVGAGYYCSKSPSNPPPPPPPPPPDHDAHLTPLGFPENWGLRGGMP